MRWDSSIASAVVCAAALALAAGCGDNGTDAPGDGDAAAACSPTPTLEDGDAAGHLQPLGSSPTEARAGRLTAADLPADESQLLTWAAGDYVLANDHIALVIEAAGPSDLYDPWGGRPVGLARVVGGRLVQPARFGEVFFLTGRASVATEAVTVLSDGAAGGPAIVRARGHLQATPFFESLLAGLAPHVFADVEVAIDYSLAPGADHVDVTMTYASSHPTALETDSTIHATMFSRRMPVFQPGRGFDETLVHAPWVGYIDERATSWAYIAGDGELDGSISQSGFIGVFKPGFGIAPCTLTTRLQAKLVIGGPGLDNLVAAAGRVVGTDLRTITGTVQRNGGLLANVTVHATDGAGMYFTHAITSSTGQFVLHVPRTASVKLEAIRLGDPTGVLEVGTAEGPVVVPVPAEGDIRVHVSTSDGSAPIRVQFLPAMGTTYTPPPPSYGGPATAAGRYVVAFPTLGDITQSVPPGTWQVIVSRGYEYELFRTTVTVAPAQLVQVQGTLERAIDTTGVQCADFHVHTWRSSDSGDDSLQKVRQAVADGLELPVRSDHEWVADFSREIAALGVESFAAAFGSVELTSFQVWGHMGVFPLVPDPTQQNAGAPKWQTYPSPESPETPFETLSPPRVFELVRARPEAPVVIINHPRGGSDYFNYVGFDPATGLVETTADWDTKFTLVEVFNDSGWLANRTKTVEDWFGLLRAGRKIFAVGSSDSHELSRSPVGYPRTCLAVGTDIPSALTANQIRDTLAAGHAVISGGIYVSATIAGAGPGDTTTGAGNPLEAEVTVRAATWVDVDAIDVVVDGTTVDTIPIMPGDADPTDPAVRWRGTVPVQTRASGGFVVVAAYGDQPLEPVHPGRLPFGVTNPIFVVP